MRLKNDSRLNTDDILSILRKYEKYFTVEVDNSMETVISYSGHTFVNASDGIYITKPHEGCKYGGLSYSFGACTIFIHDNEIERFGNRQNYLYENRIIHEILHHFDKPCHDIDDWCKKNIVYKIMWFILAKKNGETMSGAICERLFYLDLLKDVNEKKFDVKNRDYTGKVLNV